MMTACIKNVIPAILIGLIISFTLSAQTPGTIAGKWKAEEDASRQSEIYLAKDGFYYGKLIYEGGKTENIGKLILKKLRYDDTAKTFKGTMNPPDRDIQFSVTVSFSGNDKLKIVAKKFLITKTLNFIRINEL